MKRGRHSHYVHLECRWIDRASRESERISQHMGLPRDGLVVLQRHIAQGQDNAIVDLGRACHPTGEAPWYSLRSREYVLAEQLVLEELQVQLVSREDHPRFQSLLRRHHYLQGIKPVGERLYYVAVWRGQWLALLTVDMPDPSGYGRIVRRGDKVLAIVEQKRQFVSEVFLHVDPRRRRDIISSLER